MCMYICRLVYLFIYVYVNKYTENIRKHFIMNYFPERQFLEQWKPADT